MDTHELLEKSRKETESHLKLRDDFNNMSNVPDSFDNFNYLMFYIWVHHLKGKNNWFGSNEFAAKHQDEDYKDETVKVSFPMLKDMLAKTYNLGFGNGLSVGKNEAEKYWKKKIDEETNKTEADNDRYWKNRIKGYCNHRWKVIPNPISDYDDYICEICGERK